MPSIANAKHINHFAVCVRLLDKLTCQKELIEIKCCLLGSIPFCLGGGGQVGEKDDGSGFLYQQRQRRSHVPAAHVE